MQKFIIIMIEVFSFVSDTRKMFQVLLSLPLFGMIIGFCQNKIGKQNWIKTPVYKEKKTFSIFYGVWVWYYTNGPIVKGKFFIIKLKIISYLIGDFYSINQNR